MFLKTDGSLFPLLPVVSSVIRDKKVHSDLQIFDYSDDTSPVEGGKKILLFCDKINKDDIEVHFTAFTKGKLLSRWIQFLKIEITFLYFHFSGGEAVTCKGDFNVNNVHKQFGISLKTPAYPNREITSPVKVRIILQ